MDFITDQGTDRGSAGFEVMANAQPERAAQVSIVDWLPYVLPTGSVVFAVKNEQKAKSSNALSIARFNQKRRAEGLLFGFPDVGILLPSGRCCFIETKRPKGGVLSVNQQDVHKRLRDIDHFVGVATDIDTARWLFHQWGIKLREPSGQPMRPAKFRLAHGQLMRFDPMPF